MSGLKPAAPVMSFEAEELGLLLETVQHPIDLYNPLGSRFLYGSEPCSRLLNNSSSQCLESIPSQQRPDVGLALLKGLEVTGEAANRVFSRIRRSRRVHIYPVSGRTYCWFLSWHLREATERRSDGRGVFGQLL